MRCVAGRTRLLQHASEVEVHPLAANRRGGRPSPASAHRGGPDPPGGLHDDSTGELRGLWLVWARVAWFAVVAGAAVVFAVGVPRYVSVLHEACRAGPCIGGQPAPGDLRVLHDMGLSVDLYAAYVLALDLFVAVVFCSVGAVIFWQRSRERAALFASFALAIFGLTWPGAFEVTRRFGGL